MSITTDRILAAAQRFRRLVLIICVLPLASCGDDGTGVGDEVSSDDPGVPAAITDGQWYRPTVAVTWQWQLQGDVNTGYSVDLYDIDLFDSPATLIQELQAAGRRVICYFSAGSFEPFRSDASSFQPAELGSVLEGFSDERWLDVRSSNVLEIMKGRLDLAVQKGCDGVEPDNMDGYQNPSGFPLTAGDQLLFNRRIANEAHLRNLTVGLKNDLDQIAALLAYYDFSVNEQCHEFTECDLLTPFVTDGKPVFNAEYAAVFVSDAAERARICTRSGVLNLRTLILPLDLDDSFRLSCD